MTLAISIFSYNKKEAILCTAHYLSGIYSKVPYRKGISAIKIQYKPCVKKFLLSFPHAIQWPDIEAKSLYRILKKVYAIRKSVLFHLLQRKKQTIAWKETFYAIFLPFQYQSLQ
jgi:hypothetical protein